MLPSMSRKGNCHDNACAESFFSGIKNEEVYLRAYNTVSEAKVGLARYFELYNRRRPHSSLDRMTPEQFYFNSQPVPKAA